ncbi:site-specific integrase [Streptomyces gardneri]|nr:site-specific integrase [Nocardia abscessus]MBF6167001.1 site-specific integrase [Streptomyces gardneri]MBF6475306.1 site-specific integrase [Nocardia abscessus]
MKRDDVDTALQLVASLGLTFDDLTSMQPDRARMPTISQYIKWVAIRKPEGTGHYRSYWPIIETAWGHRPLDSLTAVEIEECAARQRLRAVVRANSRGGRGAEANLIAAMRFLYQNAEDDGLIEPEANPAAQARKTPQPPGPAQALSIEQIEDLGRVASTTGDDTELDALILRLHIETACSRGPALALRIEDLERDDCLIRLHEYRGAIRWQPISPTLMTHLLGHVRHRGGRQATDRVLRYQNGTPADLARYQYLVRRFRRELRWADDLQVNMNWVCHTTETFVETKFGHRTARLFKQRRVRSQNTEAHNRFDPHRLATVATVLATLTGEPHPLARR